MVVFAKYRALMKSDGVLPRAYGLPKIHKKDCPLRIIISSINSPLYSLAAFLHDILFKNLPNPNSHIENSFALTKKLNNMFLDDHYELISLDVVSLFTNVPLELVTSGIAKRWHFIKNNTSIPYNEFLISLKLIILLTSNLTISFINRFLALRWVPLFLRFWPTL